MFKAPKSTRREQESAKRFCDGLRSAVITDHNGQMVEGYITFCTPPHAYDRPNLGSHIKGSTKDSVRDLAGLAVRDAKSRLFAERIKRGEKVSKGVISLHGDTACSVSDVTSEIVTLSIDDRIANLSWAELAEASKGPVAIYAILREDATSLLTYREHLRRMPARMAKPGGRD